MNTIIKNLVLSLILVFSRYLYIFTQEHINGLCMDASCSVPVAEGLTLMTYLPSDYSKLSFYANEKVIIYVKEYGPKKDLLGVVLNGVKGYIPQKFVKETKSLGKASVPAKIEFTQIPLSTNTNSASSYPISTQVSPSDIHQPATVPNNFQSQQSSQNIQHSDFHLQSSRQKEYGDLHASSDLYVVKDEDSESYHLKESISFHPPIVDSSSQSHFQSNSLDSSNFKPDFHKISNLDNFIQSSHLQHPADSQLPNPLSYNAQPSNNFGLPEKDIKSNLDLQANTLHYTQSIDPQSNALHFASNFDFQSNQLVQSQSHVSPKAAELEMNKFQSINPSENQADKDYDETMALFKRNGIVESTKQMTQLRESVNHLNDRVIINSMSADSISKPLTSGQTTNQIESDHTVSNYGFVDQAKSSVHQYVSRNGAEQLNSLDKPNLFSPDDLVKQVSHGISSQYVKSSSTQFIIGVDSNNQLNQQFSSNQLISGETSRPFKAEGTTSQFIPEDKSKQLFIDDSSSIASSELNHKTNQITETNHPILNPSISITSNINQDDSSSLAKSNFHNSIYPSSTESSSVDSAKSLKPDELMKMSTLDRLNTILNSIKEDDNEDNIATKDNINVEEVNTVADLVQSLKPDELMKRSKFDEMNTILNSIVEDDNEDNIAKKDNIYVEGVNTAPDTDYINNNDYDDNEEEENDLIVNNNNETQTNQSEAIDETSNTEETISSNNILAEDVIAKTFIEDSNKSLSNEASALKSKVGTDIEIIAENNDLLNLTLNNVTENNSFKQSDNDVLSNLKISQEKNIDILDNNYVTSLKDNENPSSHNVSEADSLVSEMKNSVDNFLNASEGKEIKNMELNSAYQSRHLNNDVGSNDNLIPNEEVEQTLVHSEFNLYYVMDNSFEAIRSFVEALLPWIPEPLYSVLIDLEKDGISPKVPVFTALCAVPCIVLMVLLVYIKEKSKEKKLIEKLTILEKNLYNLTAEKNILEEKLEKMEVELQISRSMLEEEKISSFKIKTEIDSLKQQLEETTVELEKNVDEVDVLREREREYIELIRDHEKEHLNLLEIKTEVENKYSDQEGMISNLKEQLQEKEAELEKLSTEKSECMHANEIYEEKITQLQKNCNQLLQEAEVWNLRVQELSEKLIQETNMKEELEKNLNEKNIEIESLTQAVQIFKSFEEIGETDDEEHKSSEEKIKYLINSSYILLKLQKQEEESKLLSEKLNEEKNKLLNMEVSILDVKSENDKLKLNYNQALQDKAEAQTKLDVLTNYFKDKEIQLQKQLGVQEAVRQKTEEDASSAERRICLIEQENSSYKYQVATMKQEMEETERNLKSQIAMQEKKAHENWLAARTAERKLEDTKQEVMQLRQRLTLLEREQENWSNSTRDEIIRPMPKRIGNVDTMTTQDSNSSIDLRPNMFPPPMMLPPDRPLPPLPPLPPFLPPPPFEPPHFRPQPWNLPPDPLSNSDYRMTPPEFGRGRESTPPRGRNSTIVDGDMGPRQSSPITDMKDSRNSTPPHLLPDFHDIPPHPSRPFYPPPPMGPRSRFPPPRFPPPNFKREYNPGQRRLDNQDENNSNYGSQNSSVPPEDWHNPNSRV